MPIVRRNTLRNYRNAAHPYLNRLHFHPHTERPRGWMNEELNLRHVARYCHVKQYMLDLLNGQSPIFRSIARGGAFKDGNLPTPATSVAIIRGYLLDCERSMELIYHQRRNLARMASEAYHAMLEVRNMPTNVAVPVQQHPPTVLDGIMRNREGLNGHRNSPFGQPRVQPRTYNFASPEKWDQIFYTTYAHQHPSTVLDSIMRNREGLNGHRNSPFGQRRVQPRTYNFASPEKCDQIFYTTYAHQHPSTVLDSIIRNREGLNGHRNSPFGQRRVQPRTYNFASPEKCDQIFFNTSVNQAAAADRELPSVATESSMHSGIFPTESSATQVGAMSSASQMSNESIDLKFCPTYLESQMSTESAASQLVPTSSESQVVQGSSQSQVGRVFSESQLGPASSESQVGRVSSESQLGPASSESQVGRLSSDTQVCPVSSESSAGQVARESSASSDSATSEISATSASSVSDAPEHYPDEQQTNVSIEAIGL